MTCSRCSKRFDRPTPDVPDGMHLVWSGSLQSPPMDDAAWLADLEPTVDRLLERHLASAKDWYPHEFVPWSRGRDYVEGEEWDPEEFPLSDGVRSALYVNLLTEDNLPHYFLSLRTLFRGDAWAEWANRWVAEEDRHAQVMRDYLLVSRAIDPRALERARMVQLANGQVPDPATPLEGIIYVALQELATRLSHRNTGTQIEDPFGREIMKRISTDENFHHLFYRDLCQEALEADPSAFVRAAEVQVLGFEMPGTGIPGFDAHARVIAASGIYDLESHLERILRPVLTNQWKLFDRTDLDPEAEASRERIAEHMHRMERASTAQRKRRERRLEREAATIGA